MENYLTPEGIEKLKKELDQLKNSKRREIAERLAHAISFGDLTENAAYQEAKDAQGFLEGRILELEKMVRGAKIVDRKKTGWVQVGSMVILASPDNTKDKFQIVGPIEANPLEGRISCDSPLGKMLLNKPEGAIVEVETPVGKTKYKILNIE